MADMLSASDILDFDRPIRESAKKALEMRRRAQLAVDNVPVLERAKQGELYEQPEPDPDELFMQWLGGEGTGSFWKDLGMGLALGGLAGPVLEASGKKSGVLDWTPGGGIGKAIILGALTKGGKNVLEGVTKEMMKKGQDRIPGYVKKRIGNRFGDEAVESLGGIMEKYDIKSVSVPQAAALLGKDAEITQNALRSLGAEKELDDVLKEMQGSREWITNRPVIDHYIAKVNEAYANSDPIEWYRQMGNLVAAGEGGSIDRIEMLTSQMTDADLIDGLLKRNQSRATGMRGDIASSEARLENVPPQVRELLKGEIEKKKGFLAGKERTIESLKDLQLITGTSNIDRLVEPPTSTVAPVAKAVDNSAVAEKEARIGKLMDSIAKSRSKDLSRMGKQQRKQFDQDLAKRVNELNKLERELGREPTKFDKLGRPVKVEKPAPAPVKAEPVQVAPSAPTYQVNKVSAFNSPTAEPVARPAAARPVPAPDVEAPAEPLVFRMPEEAPRPVPKELRTDAPEKTLNLSDPKTVEEVLAAGWKPAEHRMPADISIGRKDYAKSGPVEYDRYAMNELGDESKRNLYYGDSLATNILRGLYVKDAFKQADFKKLFGESKKGRHDPNKVNYGEMMRRFNEEISEAVKEGRMSNVEMRPKMVARNGRIEPKRDAAGDIIYTPVLDLNGARTPRTLWQYAPYQGNDINPGQVDLYDLFLRRYVDDVLEAENPTYMRPTN